MSIIPYLDNLTTTKLHESSGPSDLTIGAVTDGALVHRSGTSLIGTTPMDVVGGRLDASVATTPTNTLIWNWVTSNQIRLYNGNSWEVINVTTNPTAIVGTNLDMCGNALTYDKVYDVYAKYNSATSFDLAFAPWSSATHGDYNTGVTTCTTTMTSNSLPVPCLVVKDVETSGTFAAWKAFDGVEGDWWVTDTSALPHYISYAFGAGRAVVINKYAFFNLDNRGPSAFTLHGSNVESPTYTTDTDWTLLDTRSGITAGNSAWSSYFTFKNSTAYRHYRIKATANQGGTANQIAMGSIKLIQSTQLSSRYEPWVTGTAYKVGMRVTSTNTYACISNHTAGTFATDLAAAKWVQVNADGTDTLDGVSVYANSGAYKGYRWLGLVRLINSTGAKFVDSVNQRFVANVYNKKSKTLLTYNTSGWTCAVSAWREWGASSNQVRGEFLTPIIQDIAASGSMNIYGTADQYLAGLTINSNIDAASIIQSGTGVSGKYVPYPITAYATTKQGYNYLTGTEYLQGSTSFLLSSDPFGRAYTKILL